MTTPSFTSAREWARRATAHLDDRRESHRVARIQAIRAGGLEPRINREFRYGMSDQALYEATRGIRVIGERRNRARLAMAVFAGIIREVYEIESWHHAGSTPYQTRDAKDLAKQRRKRWEFVGHLAPEPVCDRYCGRSVEHLFRAGQQSPIVGVGLDQS